MSTPEAKRTKIVAAVPLSQISDLSDVTMKSHKDPKGIFYWILLDGEVPRFNLTPAEPIKIIFGFDMVGAVERRSFNSDAAAKPNESLAVRVQVDGDLGAQLAKLDARCGQLFAEMDGAGKWMPLVSHNDKYDNDSVKISVCFTGRCTQIKILCDGEPVKGEGFDFIKKHSDSRSSSFVGAEAKVVAKLRIWQIEGKAGLALDATQIFLKPSEKAIVTEEDAFPEW